MSKSTLIIIRRRHSRCLHVLWVDVSAWPEPRPRWRDRRDSDRLWSKVPTLGPSQRLLLLKLYTQTQNISSWLHLPPQFSGNFYTSHELSKSGGIERLVSCLRRKNFRLWIWVVSKINYVYKWILVSAKVPQIKTLTDSKPAFNYWKDMNYFLQKYKGFIFVSYNSTIAWAHSGLITIDSRRFPENHILIQTEVAAQLSNLWCSFKLICWPWLSHSK